MFGNQSNISKQTSKLNIFKRHRILVNDRKFGNKNKLNKIRLNKCGSSNLGNLKNKKKSSYYSFHNKKKYATTSSIEIKKASNYVRNVDFMNAYREVNIETASALQDSITDCEQLFEWIVYPLKKTDFFKNHWEKMPLHIKRNKPNFYRNLLSTSMLDSILRENVIIFSKNIDITCFSNDIRETHNPPGRALPSIVWDYYANGCSIRLLNPQVYIQKLHVMNATLQEFFCCFVGANLYLTPPNSQGFAPHYDDIEAFVLQIEGKKRWRLYKPRTEKEYLPREASPNLTQNEIGEPILETIVTAGDLLYFPRGTIHQGDTLNINEHSLHITISVYQKNSWGDFLDKLLPISLTRAVNDDVMFRKGLPLDYSKYIGSACSTASKNLFQDFKTKLKFLLNLIFSKYLDINKAADEMFKNNIHDFLPPILNEDENLYSVYAGGEKMIDGGIIINQINIELDTFIRLSRFHCSRLVKDDYAYHLYYSCDNSKEYHEYELQYLEVDEEFVPAIQKLYQKFPHYIRVKTLPINETDKKIQIVRDLWEKGIIIAKVSIAD
ncbi:ribosomal oxygenase 1 [Phymastichus coffea]|uniref:ribosomal oxygenase 1 n=1 Tax=Phymastichus coffea TaxID=108790 RepID=UPI00273C28DB|nr:ribosomal oxygenase 1 [Phymastichus coffea]